ncbi:MAG TPA: OsmC family peroxiredoxin [Segeticoccus sp.]|uniref:OsmC family peroxiredoxin n=1 Tax=Segeticoccus sp. TaxID=2706531 RepID=UPI002D7FB6AB|nr:OsmC family peroxiredoxin [Segeticoccus sp.]HET8599973.1 OsmC family peroxiredoxin [Segeticoccus sp.]
MPLAERSAEAVWEGNLAGGKGTVTPATGAFDTLPVSWAARTEQPGGKTSPEELAAAAHASCYSMALSNVLDQRGAAPERLTVSSTVTLDKVDDAPTVVSSALTVRGRVPGLDEAGFKEAAEEAAAGCPISRLFAGAKITVDATLDNA